MHYCVKETDTLISNYVNIEERNINSLLKFIWKIQFVKFTETYNLMPFLNIAEVFHIISVVYIHINSRVFQ